MRLVDAGLHLELRLVSHNLLRMNCQSWGKEWLRDLLRDVDAVERHIGYKSLYPIVIAVQEALS